MSTPKSDKHVKGMFWDLPRGFIYSGILLLCLLLVPPVLILRARLVPSDKPRIHIIQNMDNQPKFLAQHQSLMFEDGRAMRPRVAGTVAQGEMVSDTHYWLGLVDGAYATAFPNQVAVDDALLDRGRERYDIYCLPCHGVTGAGDGRVHTRAMVLLNSGVNGTVWVQPRNLHQPDMQNQPPGRLFHTISKGFGSMAGYAAQIPVADRWAITAWIYALQVGRNAPADAVAGSESLPVKTRSLDGGAS
ncbi:MAG: quinol:cytochrome C oxidoreductase [Planctomycetaceae bacterium]|nr:quinol:cytochrome C oxidoreductase [Planctomycetaceae bacterium]